MVFKQIVEHKREKIYIRLRAKVNYHDAFRGATETEYKLP